MRVAASLLSASRIAGSPLSAVGAWRAGLTAIAGALVTNVIVVVVARALGADMLVRTDLTQPAMAVGFGMVALLTVVPMLLGTLLLLPLRRRGAKAWRVLAVVGLVVALVTVPAPFTVLAQAGTQVALASMHVVAGVAWFVAVTRAAAGRAVA